MLLECIRTSLLVWSKLIGGLSSEKWQRNIVKKGQVSRAACIIAVGREDPAAKPINSLVAFLTVALQLVPLIINPWELLLARWASHIP